MNNTPAKKAKSEAAPLKDEKLTPSSARSLRIDTSSDDSLPPLESPASSAQVDMAEAGYEQFWQSAAVEAASQISAILASNAIKIASQFTAKQMELNRRAESMALLGRVGWPSRKQPGGPSMASLANGIPASWRLNEGLSRRAAALATPPRLPT